MLRNVFIVSPQIPFGQREDREFPAVGSYQIFLDLLLILSSACLCVCPPIFSFTPLLIYPFFSPSLPDSSAHLSWSNSLNNPPSHFPSRCFISLCPLPTSDVVSLINCPSFSIIHPSHPPLTTGHLLRDRLPNMCGSRPAVRRSGADNRHLLLYVPLLWQLRRRDAPTPEEERGLPAWPAGNAALLHLAGHHVSMTHAYKHTTRIRISAGMQTCIFQIVCVYACKQTLELNVSYTSVFYSVMHTRSGKTTLCTHTYTSGHLVSLSHTQSHQLSPSPMLFAIYSKFLL